MTLPRFRAATLAALCLFSAWMPVRAADDPLNAPSTFRVPGLGNSNGYGYGNGNGSNNGGGTTTIRNDPSPPPQDGAQQRRNDSAQQRRDDSARDPRGNGPDDAPTGRARSEPPPKPSEFQKFVEGATGRLLPLFGSRFFAEGRDAMSPVDNVPVSSDYAVGPGDEVNVRAWGSIDVDYRATVDRNGLLNLPRIGSFNVAGVKASDLEANLRGQIGKLYTNFNLSVSLGQLRGLKVFVVGPAVRPGTFTLQSQATLLSAVVRAGGPAPNGSMRRVLLRRDGRVVSDLDIYEFLVQGDKSKDVQLVAGDVVVFQPAGARVALNGAFDTPAIYELKLPQEPVREVLRYAGGTPTLANPNKAQLERVDALQPKARTVEELRLDGDGLQKPLRDGDVLTLLPISPQFANAVTLKGHVAQPLRYPYQPGMRIRDLIPDRDALVSPDFYRRKNMLVQMLEPEDDVGDERRDTMRRRSDADRSTSSGGDSSGVGADDPNAAIARDLDSRRDPASRSTGRADRLSRADDQTTVRRARRAPTVLFDELNWDYAVIERLNPADLSTQVIPFSPRKAILQNDEASNLPLQPGDVVTIYSQQDIRVPIAQQTRLVSLEGEIASPGVYQLLPGETLRALVARAGGFTPQAYVYGLDFSREETRQRQRENLATAITRLEGLAAVQTARDAANRRDDATISAVSSAATQAQISRLRNVQPNGRIALELEPQATSLDALPEVPLDAGDRILVPPRPGFVTVAGAVVNSNAFLWRPGRTAGEYLRLAGTDEAADTSNMFILRADGTVTHAGDRRGWFGSGKLESFPLQPGDALFVPTQLDFETWGRAFVRNLKDFAQIFTGFGIGIAAINSL